MKNKIPLIFSLNLLFALAFGSCKTPPCPEYEVKVDTAFISEARKAPLQSYHGFDSLKFLTEKGDTITFIGQGKNIGYIKVDNFAEDNCSTKSNTYKQYEGYTFYPLSNYSSEIEYYISRDLNSNSGTYFYILTNKFTFYTSSFLPPLDNPIYFHNLSIENEIYNNVLKIYQNYDPKKKSFIFYSKDDGIIQINFENGQTLT